MGAAKTPPHRSEGGDGGLEPPEFIFSDEHYVDVLDSMGHAVYVFDVNSIVMYWNRSAELLFGYSAAEALGCHVLHLLTDAQDHDAGVTIVSRVSQGEAWTGLFPVTHKKGRKILAYSTVSPFYDDTGALVGEIGVACDSRPFEGSWPAIKADAKCSERDSVFDRSRSIDSAKLGLDPHQPLQVTVASRISKLASKVGNKIKSILRKGENVIGESHVGDREDSYSSGSTPIDCASLSSFEMFAEVRYPEHPSLNCAYEMARKLGFDNIIASKADSWLHMKGTFWVRKGSEHKGVDVKTASFASPTSHNDCDSDSGDEKSSTSLKSEILLLGERSQPNNDNALHSGSRSWSPSIHANSSCSASSCSIDNNVGMDSDNLDHEILWDDLTLGQQIGQGSSGTVYHATWFGSDVAVKAFSKQEFSDEEIFSFRQEVSLMKRLSHLNVLVLMGAVTSPQHLCIVTEFLPRGSLFQLIQKNVPKLDWRRRTLMALDIARGMNYLHHCDPPIIHCNLKSSNLLVDKNWTVKVGDFGQSSLKHETVLTTKNNGATAQWMAPEVLRNKTPDEKSDIYSFGVILWELATEKIPWDNLNLKQVTGLVGFLNRRLDIPEDVDPLWAYVIESCWREPEDRPAFQELLDELKGMLKYYSIKLQPTIEIQKEL